jgi:predicted outer membrane repeat protein
VASGGSSPAAGGLANVTGGRAGAGGSAGTSAGTNAAAGAGGSDAGDCVIRVAETGSASHGGGPDWTQALATVQQGLDEARLAQERGFCGSVEIWVAAGTYYPSAATDPADARTATFQLLPQVALYGGFAGTEAERADRDVEANISVLSGDMGMPGYAGDNAYHVVTGATGATLDGFTITGGYANDHSPHNIGGGMYNVGASPTVANCRFESNTSAGGSAMYDLSSSPLVTNCTFSDNVVEVGDGGAMYNDASSPTLTHCTFTRNGAEYSGGAMLNTNSSSPTLTHCTFTNNSAPDNGGAIFNISSTPLLEDCTFVDNGAAYGGAISSVTSAPVVMNSTFLANIGYRGGALGNFQSSASVVTNSVFVGNNADASLGSFGEILAAGAAIYDENSSPVVTGCTFAGNSADTDGGGIYNTGSVATVTNSILWGDTAEGVVVSEIVDADSSSSTVTFSIVEGGYAAGMNVTTSDPLFLDAANGNYELAAGSPAIDAGSGCGNYVTLTDQAGHGRWDIASVADVISGFDLGAFEYQGTVGVDTPISAFNCP